MATTVGINHVGISIPNIDAAVQWYIKNLDFKLLKGPIHFKRDPAIPREEEKHIFRVYPDPFAEALVAYMLAPNGVGWELFQFKEPEQKPSSPFGPELYTRTGPYHVAVTNVDPETLCAKLVGAGAKKLAGPVGYGTSMIIYVEDPWGVVLEICNKSFDRIVLDA